MPRCRRNPLTEAEPSIGDFGNFQSKFPPGADEFKSRLAAPSIGYFDYYYVGVHTYVRERHSDVIKTSISFRPSLMRMSPINDVIISVAGVARSEEFFVCYAK